MSPTGEQVEALVHVAVDRHGRLDVMANVAGVMHRSTVLETTEEDLDRLLSINLKGVFFGCQAAGRVMAEQGSGSIVNMASAAVDQPARGPGLLRHGQGRAGPADQGPGRGAGAAAAYGPTPWPPGSSSPP